VKLPDFLKSDLLNNLKSRMGIPRDKYGSLEVIITAARLTADELDRLWEGEGIEVGFDDVATLEDGTLVYKNARVLLYIRDIQPYLDKFELPKFHVARCQTLKSMNEIGRSHRYLISSRIDGVFRLNVINGLSVTTALKELNVCQNCLATLEFDGFTYNWNRQQRQKHVASFTPARFFEQYPRLLDHTSNQGADVAPLNSYTHDFDNISREVRESAGWKCQAQSCRFDCSSQVLRHYLHVHHIDGNKANNSRSNFKVLCIECHAKQPLHAHLKNTPQYKNFRRIRYSSEPGKSFRSSMRA
jgi:hypothetical protein